MGITLTIFIVTILAEGIWETLKKMIPSVKESTWNCINIAGSVIIGITVAILTETNVFVLLAIPLKSEIIGLILTGILISRGSNYIHDLIKRIGANPE